MALDQLPGCTFFRLCIFAKVPALLFMQQYFVVMSLRDVKYFFSEDLVVHKVIPVPPKLHISPPSFTKTIFAGIEVPDLQSVKIFSVRKSTMYGMSMPNLVPQPTFSRYNVHVSWGTRLVDAL